MTATPKALTAWTELNDRQQGTLRVIYQIDQANEKWRRQRGTSGSYDTSPASEWRRIDFAHDPSGLATTDMQLRLDTAGWHNQGNGSTVAALADRGMLTRGERGTLLGVMLTVTLTREGRAAARAGLSLQPGGAPKAGLRERAWEVLALLWAAGQRGETLKWGYSATIEFVLIAKHVPALAERVPGGYTITSRGQDFYRQQYAAHTAAHPAVRGPHPDGAAAEPWPADAGQILARHRRRYTELSMAWQAEWDAHKDAAAEASTAAPDTGALPVVVAQMAAARHQLWCGTAQQRAALAAAQAAELHTLATRAARTYAVAALAVFRAAVTRTDPLAGLGEPRDDDTWDEPRLEPPAVTGIHAIDEPARRLHSAAVGVPVPRRGPAPKRRRSSRPVTAPERPGQQLALLAGFLKEHTDGGALLRRLHPDCGETKGCLEPAEMLSGITQD